MWSSTRGKSVALVSAIGWESHAMVYLWEAKPFEVCGSLDTVYQKQEELNQRKRVLPVLNNELKGVWLKESLASIGNIQPESRK